MHKLEGLASESYRLGDRTVAREQLRPHSPPMHLCIDVVARCAALAELGRGVGFLESPELVERSGEVPEQRGDKAPITRVLEGFNTRVERSDCCARVAGVHVDDRFVAGSARPVERVPELSIPVAAERRVGEGFLELPSHGVEDGARRIDARRQSAIVPGRLDDLVDAGDRCCRARHRHRPTQALAR